MNTGTWAANSYYLFSLSPLVVLSVRLFLSSLQPPAGIDVTKIANFICYSLSLSLFLYTRATCKSGGRTASFTWYRRHLSRAWHFNQIRWHSSFDSDRARVRELIWSTWQTHLRSSITILHTYLVLSIRNLLCLSLFLFQFYLTITFLSYHFAVNSFSVTYPFLCFYSFRWTPTISNLWQLLGGRQHICRESQMTNHPRRRCDSLDIVVLTSNRDDETINSEPASQWFSYISGI